MKVVVTGGSGFVGKRLHLVKPDWIYLSSKDLDLTKDKNRPEWMKDIIKEIEGPIKKDPKKDDDLRILKGKLEIKDLITKIKNVDLHNFKFLVDVYLNLSNSTLSLTGVGFDTLTKSRFEYFYPMDQSGQGSKNPPGSGLLVKK